MSSSNNKLIDHVISLSSATTKAEAFLEWELDYIESSSFLEKCPCGVNIKDICYIKNIVNGNKTFVGNECIKIFTSLSDTKNIFEGLKRIKTSLDNAANRALVSYARKRGYINEYEFNFAMNTCRKRILSDKQTSTRRRINYKIVTKFSQ